MSKKFCITVIIIPYTAHGAQFGTVCGMAWTKIRKKDKSKIRGGGVIFDLRAKHVIVPNLIGLFNFYING